MYGKKKAVCFTEMPLLNFWQYAENRQNDSLVSSYGIALPKNWMYAFGARNMIYGTTDSYTKQVLPSGEVSLVNYPMPNELYRYIVTDLIGYKDWMHEREWRWSDVLNLSKHDGLPVWILNDQNKTQIEYDFGFYPIIIIVTTNDEINAVRNLLQNLLNTTSPFTYNHCAIRSTRIISKETVVSFNHNNLLFTGLQWRSIGFKEVFDNGLYSVI